MNEELVTVIALTYNHRKYIRDMMRGFLNQKTNFKVQYIIHDDASTDGTKELLMWYQEKYPDMFEFVFEEENQWNKGVKITQKLLVPLIRGKYVAFCEGDDCWIDKNKLQEQVDFLENNPEYVCVGHNSIRWYCGSGAIVPQNNYEGDMEIEPKYIIDRKFPFLATASKVYRKEAFILDGFFLNSGEVGDMSTEYNAILKGKFYYIDKIMSVYRYETETSWTKKMKDDVAYCIRSRAQHLRFLYEYDMYTEGKYRPYVYAFMIRACHYFVDTLNLKKVSKRKFLKYKKRISKKYEGVLDKYLDELERIASIMSFGKEAAFKEKLMEAAANNDLYIYGAGRYGKLVYNFIRKNKIPCKGFAVTDMEDNLERDVETDISLLDNVVNSSKPYKIILGIGGLHNNEVVRTLRAKGVDDFFDDIYPDFKGMTRETKYEK